MEEESAAGLADRVRTALRDTSGPLWFPGLTKGLVAAAWRKLDRDLGLTPASYGTARVLRGDPTAARQVVAAVAVPSVDATTCEGIPIELLPDDLARRFADPELRFFSAGEIVKEGVRAVLQEALEVLGRVPTMLPTICSLVRALHLVDTQDDEIDVSFSDPGIPFSAFISVPGPGAVADALRVAEALLHEAMHLQLTLVEQVVPLVIPTQGTYFSPWRGEYRSAQGVLHALYVFQVIDAFFGASSAAGAALAPFEHYARDRRREIASQVSEIQDFCDCADLTEDGAAVAALLLF